jgi:dTDP-4-dehydrorhamnose reductase
MKFLVLGCKGMAGHMIAIYLNDNGHNVVGFDRYDVSYCKSIKGDAFDGELVKSMIRDGKFDVIINCIGILNQFAEENKSRAVFLNSYFPHMLAELTSETPTTIIHMSTDCVFSGERGGYTEDDFPDGKTFYDRTKALGEIMDNKNITFRNSIVGPDINNNGIGLFNWFMLQEKPVSGYVNVFWTGVTTLNLAKAMEQAALERVHGLFNLVNEESISKYDLLKLFNKYLRNNHISINADDRTYVNKSLKRKNFNFTYRVPDYEEMVSELSVWIKNHRNLYPHYKLDY